MITTSHDDPDVTVRLVRRPDGSTYLAMVRNAHPWVLRKPILESVDVD